MTAPVTPQNLNKFLQSPEAEWYFKVKKEHEKKQKLRSPKPPWWALGSLGTGAGLYGLGSWVLRPEDANNLQELMAMNNMVQDEKAQEDWKNPAEFYTQYLDRAGRAARSKMFGGRINARDFMVFYRTHIEPRVGGSYPIKTKEDREGADEHYNTFASGPLLSHLHMVKKLTAKRDPAVQTEILENVAKSLSTHSGLAPERLLDLKNPIKPSEASFSDQLQTVRKSLFENSTIKGDPVTELLPRLAAGNARAVAGYAPLKFMIKATHDLPRAVGLGLAGVGLAGLGGWGAYRLYNKLTQNKQDAVAKRELNKARTQAATTYSDRVSKAAAAYPAYLNHNVQQMLPISARRELSPAEMLQVAAGEKQWIPKIFESLNDSPSVNMASPARQSLLWGAGIGLPMALSSAANTGSATQGLGTGIVAGSLAAAIAYHLRRQKNEDIEETMRRLPEGANLRDFQADPLMAERRRMAHENRLRVNANFGY